MSADDLSLIMPILHTTLFCSTNGNNPAELIEPIARRMQSPTTGFRLDVPAFSGNQLGFGSSGGRQLGELMPWLAILP
jgi:hypothetical protein